MRMRRRVTVTVGVLALAAATVVGPAAAAQGISKKVGPKQYFTGVINGTDGNTSTPIVIKMSCAEPLSTGEKGHPVAGQTLAVHELFPPSSSAAGSLGYTGKGSSIEVFFNAVPPSTASGTSKTVTFTKYDKTQKLPTSESLPCSGSGTVYFSPVPVVPPSRSASVPVDYVALVP
jgi:hypothetical protein